MVDHLTSILGFKKELNSVTHHTAEVLREYSCSLMDDLGQLPPVIDLPLYSSVP